MEMKVKLVAAVVSTMLLAGCGDSAIDRVKNAANGYDSTYTNEQLLSNKNFCTDLEWKEFTDSNNRTIVEATCQLGNPSAQLADIADSEAERIKVLLGALDRDDVKELKLTQKERDGYASLTTRKIFKEKGYSDSYLKQACGVDGFGVVLGMSFNGEDLTEAQQDARYTEVINQCVANLDKKIASQEQDLKEKQDRIKFRINTVEKFKSTLAKAFPTKDTIKVQWNLDADGKNVYIGAAELSESAGDHEFGKIPVSTSALFEQATNPAPSPLQKRLALLGQSMKSTKTEIFNEIVDASKAN